MTNPYYNPKLEPMCRDLMSNFLKLYFEFAFKVEADVTPDLVAKTNDMYNEIVDDQITTERLMLIYNEAIRKLVERDGLRTFCYLPLLFLVKNMEDLK